MERNEKIAKIMDIIADSLSSHLPYTHPFKLTEEERKKDTPQFHQKCVKEYAEVLTLLSELYD